MLLFLFVLPFVIWFVIALGMDDWKFKHQHTRYWNYDTSKILSVSFGAGMLLVFLIAHIAVNYTIRQTYEKIITYENKQKVYQERKDVLYLQYSNMLDSNYGSYEKNVFDKMTRSKGKSDINVNIYPEIKYSQTLIALSEKLQALTDNIYDCQLYIENERYWLRQIRYSPWLFESCLKL